MNYFANKELSKNKAVQHTLEMEEDYKEAISNCVKRSSIIGSTDSGSTFIPNFPVTDLRNVGVTNDTTVDAIEKEEILYMERSDKDAIAKSFTPRTAVLNFASFKHPGGMFMNGSMAQEESLCHASYLYNVLSRFQESFYKENRKFLNRSLYQNRGIYSPDVRFIFGDNKSMNRMRTCVVDVYTIAAPNAGSARRLGVSEKDISEELRRRIHFVIQNMLLHGPYKSVILGAFGCGVFKNSAEMVATLFYKELDNTECQKHFGRVVFAIVGDGNANVFQRILEERRESFGVKHLSPIPPIEDFDDTSMYLSPIIRMDAFSNILK